MYFTIIISYLLYFEYSLIINYLCRAEEWLMFINYLDTLFIINVFCKFYSLVNKFSGRGKMII